MFKIAVVFSVLCAFSFGSVVPAFKCGEKPADFFTCIRMSNLVPENIAKLRDGITDECDKNKLVFKEMGWLDGDKVDKVKVSQFYDEYGVKNPQWAKAAEQTKATCLVDDLPAQGSYLNCPYYDITVCSMGVFFKNVAPTQWSTTHDCEAAKQYAANCPYCPYDCFAKNVPAGSCNACKH